MRARLIRIRFAGSPADRRRRSAAISKHVASELPTRPALVGMYWPFKGEYDPRPFARSLLRSGTRIALPLVTSKGNSLFFREWRPGVRMAKGIRDAPAPAEGEPVIPEVMLVPIAGFDHQRYRLGYGEGFYDRVLATEFGRPYSIGIGFDDLLLETLYPQPHDMPMDVIVTEGGRR
jgi:5-formyltetrahydrofolate cyclo-ligase